MQTHYHTLRTIYDIVRNDSQPHTYLCNPREIIVRQLFGWDIMNEHLRKLSDEGLVECKLLGTYAIQITLTGLEKAKELWQANLVVQE